ncbi:MAG: hypothetical protein GY861_08840 [bacterium]|nr:hypothetical protein [bacterium]
MSLKLNLSAIFIIIFIPVFLWLGCGTLFDHQVSHEFPYAYFASDAFLHQGTAEAIKDAGHYNNMPAYITGGFDGVVGMNPPLLNQIAAAFSHATGIEVYDTIYLFIFISALLAVLVLYLIVRKFNENVALLALPLSFLIFTKNFYTGMTFGQWDFYLGLAFFMGVAWCLMRIGLKGMNLLLAVFLAASFLTHPPETFWAIGFIGVYSLIRIIRKKFTMDYLKKMLIAGGASALLILSYLPLFIFFWLPTRSTQVLKSMDFPTQQTIGYPVVLMKDFGLLQWIIALGMVVALIYFIRKKYNIALVLGVYSFIIGFTVLIGFDKAMQVRFMWPVLLSIFFGLAIYAVLKIFVKKWNIVYTVVIALILLIAIPSIFNEERGTSRGIMDKYHWDGLTWIADNAPEDAQVLYFYGIYEQSSMLYNSKRMAFFIDPLEYIKSIQNGSILNDYEASLAWHGHPFPYKTSLISYDNKLKPDMPQPEYFAGRMDVCNFDYLVLDKVTSNEVVSQYNMFLRQTLLEAESIDEAYSNDIVSILRNKDPGVDCLA